MFWRINLTLILVILFGAAIIGRLIYIQIFNYQYWRALAYGQQRIFMSFKGERGEVFFQDKTPFAINRYSDLVYASPKEINNPQETAEVLALILGIDYQQIVHQLKKNNFYELIKRNLNEQEIAEIKKLNLPGIYLGKEISRYYPYQFLGSKVIGFLDRNGQGQYGIEGYYDNILQGKEEVLEKEKGPGGYFINTHQAKEENPLKLLSDSETKGYDIILTIDYNIQFMAEKLLEKAKENLYIESGEIVVIDPNLGKILALADFPNFNPNEYSEVTNFEIFKNSSIHKVFEPGSVFKPITMAAALDQGKITPQTTYTDEGQVQIGNYTIYNYDKRVWGERTMTEVLEKSINTGAIFAERQLGHNLFLEYLERFGFFEPTGIDLQGEIFSQNKEFKKGYEINFATASFGQGFEITSLQLVRAFSAIANGGKLINPHLINDNSLVAKKDERQIISKNTSSQITMMLVSTVENGFAKKAKIPGYYVAGKTGTAQIPYENKRGYHPDKTIQSFIGFAPAFDPQFLILVKLYNPNTKTAEYSAVPIFRELAKYIIDYWQISPDYEEN